MTASPAQMDSAQPVAGPNYIHATAVMIDEAGLLILGPSRAGKSSLALALLAEVTQRGCYGCLIGDDRISIESCGKDLVLRGHPAISGKIEQRGTGILDIPWTPSGPARYVIDLVPQTGSHAAVIETTKPIEGITLPLFRLPFSPTVEDRAKLLLDVLQKAEANRLNGVSR